MPVFENVRYSLTGVSVAVRVRGVAHFFIFRLVFKQNLEIIVYCLLIRADKLERACFWKTCATEL